MDYTSYYARAVKYQAAPFFLFGGQNVRLVFNLFRFPCLPWIASHPAFRNKNTFGTYIRGACACQSSNHSNQVWKYFLSTPSYHMDIFPLPGCSAPHAREQIPDLPSVAKMSDWFSIFVAIGKLFRFPCTYVVNNCQLATFWWPDTSFTAQADHAGADSARRHFPWAIQPLSTLCSRDPQWEPPLASDLG